MRSERPPLLARWLLQRLYSGPNPDAVIGDLLERHQASPSSVWYWRQALTTIVVSLLWAIRAHKMLAIRAVLSGYAAAWLLGLVLFYLARGPVGSAVETLFGESRYNFFGTWGTFITFAGAGWTVGSPTSSESRRDGARLRLVCCSYRHPQTSSSHRKCTRRRTLRSSYLWLHLDAKSGDAGNPVRRAESIETGSEAIRQSSRPARRIKR